MKTPLVTVFGGSGFLGRHLVRRLVKQGCAVRVAVRDPEAANFLKPQGDLGQITPVYCDVTDMNSVSAAAAGADVLVNLVGLLWQWGNQSFDRVHLDGARNIAIAAKDNQCKDLIHISAIGADEQSKSRYARTKKQAEEAVHLIFPEAVILRPSVVFGPEDDFFNRFAGLCRITPALPVFGCPLFARPIKNEQGQWRLDFYGDGGTKMQPVYVEDVAAAAINALSQPAARGKVFELGGPTVYSYVALMRLLLDHIGRKRLLVPTPFAVMRAAGWVLQKFPAPMITRDQVLLLQSDNLVSAKAHTLADLGVEPTAAETVLPSYLGCYVPAGRQRAANPQ